MQDPARSGDSDCLCGKCHQHPSSASLSPHCRSHGPVGSLCLYLPAGFLESWSALCPWPRVQPSTCDLLELVCEYLGFFIPHGYNSAILWLQWFLETLNSNYSTQSHALHPLFSFTCPALSPPDWCLLGFCPK